MPNRVIRESLLDSSRYWSVSIEARQLFLHLLLLADDFACVSLAPLFLRRRCFDDPPTHERIARLIGELIDADLVRRYEADGAAYGFIPRFRQRLQRSTLKHPAPPKGALEGDTLAQEMFNKISHDPRNPTDDDPLANGEQSERQPPEVKRKEKKRSKTLAQADAAQCAVSFLKFWTAYPKKRSKGQAWNAWRALNPDEQLVQAILASIEQAKKSDQWRKDAGQFVPYPATWIRAQGWEDEASVSVAGATEIRHGQVRMRGGFVP